MNYEVQQSQRFAFTRASFIGCVSKPSHASPSFAHTTDGKPAAHRLSGQTVGVGVAAPCGGEGYAIPVCGLALPQYRLDDAWHGAVHAEKVTSAQQRSSMYLHT